MEHHVLNLGAGVQSTVLYLLLMEPGSDLKFDLAIFADTGEEPEDVYKHLEYLRSLPGPEIWVRSVGSKLGDDIITGRNSSGGRFASIPAFTAEDHSLRRTGFWKSTPSAKKIGMVRRQCTDEYKIQVVTKAIRREVLKLKPRARVLKGTIVHQYFGITTDEATRATRAKERFKNIKWAVPHYPFLEMQWSRRDCEKFLLQKLLAVPRSACVFCPFKTNREWQRLKETDPAGWKRAVEIDNALRGGNAKMGKNMKQKLYLHRSCIPLEMVSLEKETATLPPMMNECQGMCGM